MSKWSGVVREGTDAKGAWKQNVREGQGSQINSTHSGFRARKEAMHNMDGGNDANIEDRKGGDEPETEGRPAMEEKEPDEGVKEVKGTTHYKEE